MADHSEIARWKLYILMGLMVFFGAGDTIIQKYQNELTTKDENGEEIKYKHPFFQTLWMLIGEFWCLVVYKIYEWRVNKKYGGPENNPEIIEAKEMGKSTSINVLLMAIPATCDFIASAIMFLALIMIAASIYQMMRGFLVFIVAILSIIFLKRKLYRHHWTSLALILIGLAVVGVSSVLHPQDENKESKDSASIKVIFGIILVVVAQIFSGFQFIVEEKFFKNYYLHPLQLVGWEGCWGTIITSIHILSSIKKEC